MTSVLPQPFGVGSRAPTELSLLLPPRTIWRFTDDCRPEARSDIRKPGRSVVPGYWSVERIEALGEQRADEVIHTLVGDQKRSCDRIAQRPVILMLYGHAT